MIQGSHCYKLRKENILNWENKIRIYNLFDIKYKSIKISFFGTKPPPQHTHTHTHPCFYMK